MAPMQTQPSARIAFIGGGNMARALIAGLLRLGLPARQIRVGEREPAARAALEREFPIQTSGDNAEAIAAAELVVLAVKPQDAGAVLRTVGPPLREHGPVLLSIAAGLRIADLARACPAGIAIVRAMPNRPALVGAGVTGLYAPPSVTAAQRNLAEIIGAAAGRTVWLRTEAEIDIVTAVSGSGPAYFFAGRTFGPGRARHRGSSPKRRTLLAAHTPSMAPGCWPAAVRRWRRTARRRHLQRRHHRGGAASAALWRVRTINYAGGAGGGRPQRRTRRRPERHAAHRAPMSLTLGVRPWQH